MVHQLFVEMLPVRKEQTADPLKIGDQLHTYLFNIAVLPVLRQEIHGLDPEKQ
ncbi:hypothetical protein IMSAGC020_01722 [Lachnospiraceae bacterium]|nr:hypothetical protein IMSAGC020_01722 [Lachnospiraceae bacterium]